MKKLTVMLLPVMPGFNAWATQGFIETDSSANDDIKPEPLPNSAVSVLTSGYIPQGSDVVCVPYENVATFVRSLAELSVATVFQPLSRGGFLISFTLSKKGEDFIGRKICDSAPASDGAAPVVSESK